MWCLPLSKLEAIGNYSIEMDALLISCTAYAYHSMMPYLASMVKCYDSFNLFFT